MERDAHMGEDARSTHSFSLSLSLSLSHASRNRHRNEHLVVETYHVGNHWVIGVCWVEGIGIVRTGWSLEPHRWPTTTSHRA